ncbi:hypothetical protein [Flavobacterium psychrotrophum]|uniref:hypothetical protein n=1 Tax=Flavobacterium psychrotrophum TaxID=2294119 RepID=UPI0013C49CF7|nr:hypothetical protein [Flavobacterium psychrotrophum]
MKRKLLIIIGIISLISCKSLPMQNDKACSIVLYHIDIVESFVKKGYIEDATSLYCSIVFLEELTKIKSDYTEEKDMFYIPTEKNIKGWKKWYKKNKSKIYWDESNEKVKLEVLK